MNNSYARAYNNNENAYYLTSVKQKRKSREFLIAEQQRENQAIIKAYIKAAFVATVIVWILALCIVFAAARCAELKYNINEINQENTILENEIRILNSKIEGSKSFHNIESSAMKLGLIHPTNDMCIYIKPVAKSKDFCLKELIIKKAYKIP